jgi:hypothetical protein
MTPSQWDSVSFLSEVTRHIMKISISSTMSAIAAFISSLLVVLQKAVVNYMTALEGARPQGLCIISFFSVGQIQCVWSSEILVDFDLHHSHVFVRDTSLP